MPDYDKIYLNLTKGLDPKFEDNSAKYPEANSFEKSVVGLREKKYSYEEIQKCLGMPPKKAIRKALLDLAPELIDPQKVKVETPNYLAQVYYFVYCKNKDCIFEIDGDPMHFYIKDKQVYYDDGSESLLSDLDTATQAQIYNQIREQI